jgi:hypothetical protein
MSQSLADALDWCIDAIIAHGFTVPECLDAWPEHEVELASLLPVVGELRALGPVVIDRPRSPRLEAPSQRPSLPAS